MKQAYEYYSVVADQGRIFRKVVESLAALAAILLGLQFIFSGFDGVQMFLPMEIIASARLWGIGMLSLGVARGLILFVNGWWPYTYRARKYLSFCFLFGIWLPLAACFWWNFQVNLIRGSFQITLGMPYAIFTFGIELLIYYAHASFVYVARRGLGQNG